MNEHTDLDSGNTFVMFGTTYFIDAIDTWGNVRFHNHHDYYDVWEVPKQTLEKWLFNSAWYKEDK